MPSLSNFLSSVRENRKKLTTYFVAFLFVLLCLAAFWYVRSEFSSKGARTQRLSTLESELASKSSELSFLKNQDPYKRNIELEASASAIQKAYAESSQLFRQRAEMVQSGHDVSEFDLEISKLLHSLSNHSYVEASTMASQIQDKMNARLVLRVEEENEVVETNVSNEVPGSGYSRQVVKAEDSSFTVSMVVSQGARVVVDTASDSDCSNDCPTLPLSEYVSRNGGFAGINGGYFCPADYGSCQGKVNSFDTLVYNGRTNTAFNEGNNTYSTVPLVAAYGSSLSFYPRTLDWGVDGSSTGALANYPLLLQGNSISFDFNSIPSYLKDSRGTRGFIGVKGGSVVIGHVHAATVPESAQVLQTLGLEQALNLDGGGSSALWHGGYKVGPGRSLPVAIVLVQ